jgi:hypothetical protein
MSNSFFDRIMNYSYISPMMVVFNPWSNNYVR